MMCHGDLTVGIDRSIIFNHNLSYFWDLICVSWRYVKCHKFGVKDKILMLQVTKASGPFGVDRSIC